MESLKSISDDWLDAYVFSIIISRTKYERYSQLIKPKEIIKIKHGIMQKQYLQPVEVP